MRQHSEDYKLFNYLVLRFLSNILVAQDNIEIPQWMSNNIIGNPVNASLSDDPATESIYFLGDFRKNVHKDTDFESAAFDIGIYHIFDRNNAPMSWRDDCSRLPRYFAIRVPEKLCHQQ